MRPRVDNLTPKVVGMVPEKGSKQYRTQYPKGL